jgi:hypothetical protein
LAKVRDSYAKAWGALTPEHKAEWVAMVAGFRTPSTCPAPSTDVPSRALPDLTLLLPCDGTCAAWETSFAQFCRAHGHAGSDDVHKAMFEGSPWLQSLFRAEAMRIYQRQAATELENVDAADADGLAAGAATDADAADVDAAAADATEAATDAADVNATDVDAADADGLAALQKLLQMQMQQMWMQQLQVLQRLLLMQQM